MKSTETDRRNRERLSLLCGGIGTFTEKASGRTVGVVDLSYGGARLVRKGLILPADTGHQIVGTFRLGGAEVPVKAQVVHQSLHIVGIKFIHDDPTLLLFLRKYLEAARWGASVVTISRENVAESYRGPEWQVMHGDGPVTLRIRTGAGGVEELSLTVRPAGYHFVDYRDGRLTAGRMSENLHKSALEEDLERIPAEFLRIAVFVLLGVASARREMDLTPVIAAIGGDLERRSGR